MTFVLGGYFPPTTKTCIERPRSTASANDCPQQQSGLCNRSTAAIPGPSICIILIDTVLLSEMKMAHIAETYITVSVCLGKSLRHRRPSASECRRTVKRTGPETQDEELLITDITLLWC